MARQVEEAEYQRLLGRDQVATFVESIYNDPALGREARALIKKKYPDVQIPEYDIEERVNQRLDAERNEREEKERKRSEDEQDKSFKAQRSKVQKDYGFTDDGMKELEDFMVKENVGSYEVAAGYRASKEPKQSDADQDDGRDHFWNHSKQEGFKEIAADPEAWGRKEIIKALRADEAREKQWR
jgi:hypothetical protein